MTWLALPWFVLVTTHSATQATYVVAGEVIGLALLGLPGGRLLGRIGARRTMMFCDGARAADDRDPGIALDPGSSRSRR
jgi:MFS family permease